MTELQEKYEAELASQYGLTEDQVLKIAVEASEKFWPMPSLEE